MKFSKIALSIVAVLGIGVIGGSWYTGKQAEEKYHQLVAQSNLQIKQQLAPYGVQAEIKDVQLERHFFSSKVKYRFEATMGDEKWEVNGNDTLYHGPLPLNRLATLNFMPVLMSMENQLQTPEALKKVFGNELGKGTSTVSYSGALEGSFTLNPVKYQEETQAFETTPLKMDYGYDTTLKNGHIALSLDKVKFNELSDKSSQSVLQIDGLSYAGKLVDDKGYPHLGLGEATLDLKNVQLTTADKAVFALQQLQMQSKNSLQAERTSQTGKLNVAAVNISGMSLGKLSLDLGLDLEAKSVNELMAYLSSPAQLQTPEASDALLQVLNTSPKLHLNNLALEQEKGKLQSALILNIAKTDFSALNSLQDVINAFAQSKFNVQLDREYLEFLAQQAGVNLDKLSAEDAAIKAKQMVDEVFANAMGSGFAQVADNKLSSEMTIDNGKVVLNGREISESELQMALFALAMMMGSMGQ